MVVRCKQALVKAMLSTGITSHFIVVDGKEGGTGAAPSELAVASFKPDKRAELVQETTSLQK